MKLLIITCIQESLPSVKQLLQQADIPIFSISETTGIRQNGKENLLNEWFGSGRGEVASYFLFSFTLASKAAEAIQLINQFNEKQETGFPVRGFVVPVETSSDMNA
ncbi:MAG TPA: hypothetical protein VFS31_11375 [Chitinophagaceae bacterium]|nr:hypothetical protein [Chitinophagaceae bacterium]